MIQIDEINFISVKPSGTLIGFVNVKILGWLYLNSIGIHSLPPSGRISISLPGQKINNNLKPYYRFTDSEVKEQIRGAIEKYINDSGFYKTKFETNETLNYENNKDSIR